MTLTFGDTSAKEKLTWFQSVTRSKTAQERYLAALNAGKVGAKADSLLDKEIGELVHHGFMKRCHLTGKYSLTGLGRMALQSLKRSEDA